MTYYERNKERIKAQYAEKVQREKGIPVRPYTRYDTPEDKEEAIKEQKRNWARKNSTATPRVPYTEEERHTAKLLAAKKWRDTHKKS